MGNSTLRNLQIPLFFQIQMLHSKPFNHNFCSNECTYFGETLLDKRQKELSKNLKRLSSNYDLTGVT